MKRFRTITAGLLTLAMASAVHASDCPTTLKIMAPASPGGGYDQTARALQKVLVESGLSKNVQVFNVPGAGGTIGLAQLVTQSKNDPNLLMVTANVMMGAILTNKSAVSLTNTKPVSQLSSEYETIVVPADSPLKTVDDLIRELKADPGKVSWAGGSAGGIDHITAALVAKAAGVDPRKITYVAYSGGGEAMAAILGGKVTVGINTFSEFKDQIEAGALRVLALSSPSPTTEQGAPTLKSAGLDVDMSTWRMVAAAPGISDAEHKALVACVAAATATPAWKEVLASHSWADARMSGPELDSFVKDQTALTANVLREISFVQ